MVDRATAQRWARRLGVTPEERQSLGKELKAVFSSVGRSRVKLTLTHNGAEPVGLVGGRGEHDPRNERFEVEVWQDGVQRPAVLVSSSSSSLENRRPAAGRNLE